MCQLLDFKTYFEVGKLGNLRPFKVYILDYVNFVFSQI